MKRRRHRQPDRRRDVRETWICSLQYLQETHHHRARGNERPRRLVLANNIRQVTRVAKTRRGGNALTVQHPAPLHGVIAESYSFFGSSAISATSSMVRT